jgi:hypothetical protein
MTFMAQDMNVKPFLIKDNITLFNILALILCSGVAYQSYIAEEYIWAVANAFFAGHQVTALISRQYIRKLSGLVDESQRREMEDLAIRFKFMDREIEYLATQEELRQKNKALTKELAIRARGNA